MAVEARFYQLMSKPLEQALPTLVALTLERGWRAVVQTRNAERMQDIDRLLWAYQEDSFLPHGLASDPSAARQPVVITDGDANPNGATVRFLVDGARLAAFAGYDRLVFVFDGRDPVALAGAREQYKAAKAAGCAMSYWQQGDDGRWVT